MQKHPLTTEALAAALGIKPQTLRAAVCRRGDYCGVRPSKAPNRFLYWPPDSVERITGLGEQQQREGASAGGEP